MLVRILALLVANDIGRPDPECRNAFVPWLFGFIGGFSLKTLKPRNPTPPKLFPGGTLLGRCGTHPSLHGSRLRRKENGCVSASQTLRGEALKL